MNYTQTTLQNRIRVGILIFDQVETLDFTGPFEVFSVTRELETNRVSSVSPFEVILVAQSIRPVTTAGGMKVLPQYSFEHCPDLDVIVVPGGWGTRAEMKNPVLIGWLTERSVRTKVISSVCTGALLLGQAGLLRGKQATTHWRSLDFMQESFPSTKVVRDQHVTVDGRFYTSAGISAGIDMSLLITAFFLGEEIARSTARHMEYPWPESNQRRV